MAEAADFEHALDACQELEPDVLLVSRGIQSPADGTLLDEHGHDTGDAVLVEITGALRDRLRSEDEIGRLGGEEFLVLLPDSDEHAAALVAEDLRASAEAARARCRGVLLSATVSVGWATWDGDETPEELVKRADTALYAAKDAGRNAVRGAGGASASLPRRT